MGDLMQISEAYFQNLLNDTEPGAAIAGLAGDWRPRVDERKPQLGLSRTELHVHVCMLYTGEVGNGGHEQLFVNHGGQVMPLIEESLRALALADIGAIFQSAIAVFPGGKVPAEREAAEKALEAFDDKQRRALGELDRQLYKAGSSVDKTLIEYLRANADDVLRAERGLS